ncbi:hypothetical protein GGR50DRAFT_656846 [Xylaria sp. CBS 124048]|nr:hypothetical protein GGR50DRAFT_656846 [Xylaria sp. CBS 124048]
MVGRLGCVAGTFFFFFFSLSFFLPFLLFSFFSFLAFLLFSIHIHINQPSSSHLYCFFSRKSYGEFAVHLPYWTITFLPTYSYLRKKIRKRKK